MYILPIITLVAFYWQYQKKNNRVFGPISYLIFVYLIMAFSTLILHFNGVFKSVFDYKFEPMLYLSLSFILIFWGFDNYKDDKIKEISIDNIYVYKVLEELIMVGGFLAILFFSQFAIGHLLSGDIEGQRLNLTELSTTGLGSFGLFNSFMSLFSNFFPLAILFAFINLIRKKPRKAYLLFLSSTSYIIYVLAYVGRDGVVYWIMTFLFFYFLFRKFLNSKTQKSLLRALSVITILAMIPFFAISIARFSKSESSVSMNLLNYGGQQIINFNDIYQVDAQISYGRGLFPVFTEALEGIGFKIPNPKVEDINAEYLDVNVKPWTFGTYIISLKMNFGKLGTFILLIILASISRILINKNINSGRFSFSDLILFTLLYQFVLWGVFYFRFYSANFYIISIIILYAISKFNISGKVLILKKIVYLNPKSDSNFKSRKQLYFGRRRNILVKQDS